MMLKLINRGLLKENGFTFSSFILKNIVLWLAQKCNQDNFRPETLFSWIVFILLFLKRAVKLNRLPYHMIPERNLLLEKVQETERLLLEQTLSDILKSGPAMLYKCETINKLVPIFEK